MSTITEESIANMLADNVGRLNIHEWLAQFGQFLEARAHELMPDPPKTTHIVEWPHFGLSLRLSYHANSSELMQTASRWIISDAILSSRWIWAWPFGLNMNGSTPIEAAALLGNNTSGLDNRSISAGDLRQTYFLSDGRAIGITWKSGFKGYEAMHLCRLGLPLDR